ncbi:hypothetical protein CMV_002893 [Castanea mollissima]|uniref:Uncharacterized protein n=1 Tax=Castanea mollissima TaxID=60419 RepID=A0A8J4RI82_9ROSI|nr:hypothetical protein CMV_002893 [Castanea mollissima]
MIPLQQPISHIWHFFGERTGSSTKYLIKVVNENYPNSEACLFCVVSLLASYDHPACILCPQSVFSVVSKTRGAPHVHFLIIQKVFNDDDT